ncbi:hypothetical protein PtA15_10A662 [Puccinia triticina]|uniref:Protein kinase domain-containing protein n=1 Tax=Puccinia triticina TaxID=208348 RepID=A0ABY7CWC9_9BASI|nr:uncharacterized protein PtA15_10A662 [Puccinia triticina]WAQ89238.1 hypothetical protein PtA15_10A662 [Puccinia triticina]
MKVIWRLPERTPPPTPEYKTLAIVLGGQAQRIHCQHEAKRKAHRIAPLDSLLMTTHAHQRNGNSHGQNYDDRNRYRPRDRSEDREMNRKYDRNRSRGQARDRDRARDDDHVERPLYESNGRKEWNRGSDKDRGPTRSMSPSRSRSRSPSHTYSRSRSRSRVRSSSHSNSTDLYYHPVRSPSPVPPMPPRPPKSKLRPTPVARDCEVLAYDSLRSKSPSHSPRSPRRPRSFRSRTPPSAFSGSSLDGRPCPDLQLPRTFELSFSEEIASLSSTTIDRSGYRPPTRASSASHRTQRPEVADQSELDGAPKTSEEASQETAQEDGESLDPVTAPKKAPLPISPPPAIPQPPQSPKRIRTNVSTTRKLPGMPPTAPVAQTSAGVLETTHASSTAPIAHDFTHSRRTTSSQPRSRHSPRRSQYREGESGDYNHSRRSSHRFSNRRDHHDAPPDAPTDPLPSAGTKDDWGTAQKVPPTQHTAPSVHPPPRTESRMAPPGYPTQHANVLPAGLPVPTKPSSAIPSAPPSGSQTAEQTFASQQHPPQGIRSAQGGSFQAHIDGQTFTNGRRETKEIYERIVQVGEGTYGKVYKARNVETGELVAMKRIRMEAEKDGFPITAIREIKLLQGLRHPNIVNLVEMVVSKGHVYIVFEYMDHDLSGVLHHPHIHFTDAHTKSLMWQLLCGLQYMHERGVLHRDLKGSNILLNKSGQLKIADFGLARRFERGKEPGCEGRGRGRDYTNRVITLWYKPPELLFGATVYGEEVDMWSAGAIFLELFTRRPIFQTGDEIDQLYATFKLMGTPTMGSWPEAFELPWFELFKPKLEQPSRLRETFFGPEKSVRTEAGMALAERLLTLRPHDRPSARQALTSAYFTSEDPPMEMPTDILSAVKGEWHELESKRARRRRDL